MKRLFPAKSIPSRMIRVALFLGVVMTLQSAQAQVVPPLSLVAGQEREINLNFRDAPLDQVLEFYSSLTGRTMIKAEGVNATITIRGQTRLTESEALQAIESAMAMRNVALVPMGERFLRVVQTTAVRQEGMPILFEKPEEALPETDQLFSMIINLRHVEIAEVQPIIQQLLHGYGTIQPLERANSMMVTDTGANLNRVLEILSFVDQPIEIREDIHVRRIVYAEAGQIASRLNEFIQDREEQEDRPRVTPQPAAETGERRGPPGVIRARRDTAEVAAAPMDAAAELAERGVIRGRVKIVADERINTLFIIARPVNFAFFDRIIDILDQPVEPEIIVRVKHLEYALAEDIAGILNEFIGAAASDESGRALSAGAAAEEGGARAEALRDFAAGLARERTRERDTAEESGQIGRLSANTKILSDQRSNALLLMGRRGDIAALEEIIAQLDIMLGQVLIEAVIVEINLGKTQETGIDWLQRTMTAYNEQRAGPGGGLTVREPTIAFGGGARPGGSDIRAAREQLLDGSPAIGSGGLTYYLTFFDLNVDSIIRLAATSRDARILSTPVILTTDNTEAKIIVGESRPIVTSTAASSVGDRTVSSYQYRDIGIDLTVTPRINPQRYVVMEINQSADNVGGDVEIDGNRVPIITRREMQANIAVESRSTIVLGGLVSTDRTTSTTKVPLLGDIPILGRLFRSDSTEDARTELLVLITPYVLMTPEEARMESARLHEHSHSSRSQWHTGWSDSAFGRDIIDDEHLMRREDPFKLPPEDPTIPLEEGTYDRESVEHILEQLQAQQPSIQDDSVGVIRWRERDIPVVEPEQPVQRPVEPTPVPVPQEQTIAVPEVQPEPEPEPIQVLEPVQDLESEPAAEPEPVDESVEPEPLAREPQDIRSVVPMW